MSSAVLVLVGPSGIGKGHLARALEDAGFCHVDIDGENRLQRYGIRSQWKALLRTDSPDAKPLYGALLKKGREAVGCVMSLPSDAVWNAEQVALAESAGMVVVVLWGTREQALASRRQRDGVIDERKYDRKNRGTFEKYGAEAFRKRRLDAFDADDQRVPVADLVASVRTRLG